MQSQPSSAVGVVGNRQLAKPAAQVDVQVPGEEQASVAVWVVEHARPHAPQFDVEALVSVSQPSRSGAVVVQSRKLPVQPLYVHAEPVQPDGVLCVVSHAAPHAPQFDVVFNGVSHPSMSGAVVTQSPWPGLQVYVHFVPVHVSGLLFVVSQAAPHALQFDVVVIEVSHPFVSRPDVSQLPYPARQPV